jgi:hypothetical protein
MGSLHKAEVIEFPVIGVEMEHGCVELLRDVTGEIALACA